MSPDGGLLAYSVDVAGDEVYRLAFRDLRRERTCRTLLPHTYYGGAWSSDSSTFFYVVHDDVYRPFQVWRHVLGTSDTDDVCVFQEDDEKFDVIVWADRAGEFIVIHSSNRDTSEEWLLSAADPTAPATVSPRRSRSSTPSLTFRWKTEADVYWWSPTTEPPSFSWLTVPCPKLTPRIGSRCPSRRPSACTQSTCLPTTVLSLVSEGRQLLRIVPHPSLFDDPLESSHDIHAAATGGLFTLWHNEEFDASSVLIEEESYISPLAWYEVDLASGERRLLAGKRYRPTARPTMSLRKGGFRRAMASRSRSNSCAIANPLDGTAPLLLYGYGAYESAFWPGFEPSLASLLDRGVVFVHAGIRGGGYCGRSWWLGGRLKPR